MGSSHSIQYRFLTLFQLNLKTAWKFHTNQNGISECGIACLESIFKFYGFRPNSNVLKSLSGTTGSGTTLLGLFEASNNLGLKAEGYEANISELRKQSNPSILHVIINENQLHYIVCYGYNQGYFIIGDPGRGVLRYLPEDLERIWQTKRILVFSNGIDVEKFEKINGSQQEKGRSSRKIILEGYRSLFAAFLMGLLISLLSLSLAYFTRFLIDDLFADSHESNKIIVGILLLFSTLILKNVISYFREITFLKHNKRLCEKLNGYFFNKILNLPFSYHKTMRTGDLVTRLNDIFRIQNAINLFFNSLVIDILILLAIIVFIAYFFPLLSLIFVSFTIILFTATFLQTKRVLSSQKQVIESYSICESTYLNVLNGIEIVKTHNKVQLFTKLIRQTYFSLQSSLYNFGRFRNSQNLIYEITGTVLIILTIFLSYNMYLNNLLQVGSLIAFIQLSFLAISPIVNISMSNFKVQEAKIAFQRLEEFEMAGPEFNLNDDLKKEKISHFEVLSIKNLRFKFPGTTELIDNLSFDLIKGDFIAMLGKSGAGKSTLIKILQKLYTTPNGMIIVDGIEWNQLSISKWREVIGVVPQEITLFTGTLASNISLSDETTPDEVREFSTTLGLDEFFKSFPEEYNTIVGETGIMLSGGQKQLVGLARALIKKPKLLLLDEATSFMDNDTQEYVFCLLKRLSVSAGCTVLFVTHDDRLAKFANKIIKI